MDSKKYRVNKVNAYNGWDPLKQVVLGNCFTPEFFEDVGDHKLRDLMQQILYETHEDLDNIQKTLEDLDVEVIRTPPNAIAAVSVENADNICDMQFDDAPWSNPQHNPEKKTGTGILGFPRPCMTPRDEFITLGNKILFTSHRWTEKGNTMYDTIEKGEHNIFNPEYMDMFLQEQWELYQNGKISHGPLKLPTSKDGMSEKTKEHHQFMFAAPIIHRVGNRLIIDHQDWSNVDEVILERYPEFTGANIAVGGHTDGSMNLPKPGLVICCPWMGPEDFKDTLPGWDVVRIENPKYMATGYGDMESWIKEKHVTNGRWWHPEAKSSPDMVKFVEDWLSTWVGYAEESVFEVNMLSVNPETILSLNYQPEVHNALKEHGMESIYCRFRHRNFWDGGLHCLTLDTYREGGIQDYFK
jgi:hypothetical protein